MKLARMHPSKPDVVGFDRRHIGPSSEDIAAMLKVVGAASADELMAQTIPVSIALGRDLAMDPALSEVEALAKLREIAGRNSGFYVSDRTGLPRDHSAARHSA